MKSRKKHGLRKIKNYCLSNFLQTGLMLSCYVLIASFIGIGWVYSTLPDTIYVEQNTNVQIPQMPFISIYKTSGVTQAGSTVQTGSYNTSLALFGEIPLKTVRMVVTERPVVTVCGTPFGIKMLSEGALIVGFTDINTKHGSANPAKEAGLKLGDLIIQIDDKPTNTNEDVAKAINKNSGKPVELIYLRDEMQYRTILTPVKHENGKWLAGMWARDSSAGVGTMTYVDNSTGVFVGLGHSISDGDTGKSVALRSGEIMPCEITGYYPGTAGAPGELKGQFIGTLAIGTILTNGDNGLYGTTRKKFDGELMELGFAQEIAIGKAEILTTIDGTQPQKYQIEIEKISYSEGNRNLIIHVVDEALLSTAGGIVQGMSGSPIIQNGKLIGAVTHVFVNDPTRGYGIFIDNMLATAERIA